LYLKDNPMQLIKYNSTHSQSRKNKDNMQTNYVCTMKNQVTLLVTMQRKKCNIESLSTPFILMIWEMRMGTMRLDLDASCKLNGPNLSLNPTPCILSPIVIKCNKSTTMKIETFILSNASTSFINKKLMR
jgi:hypothetical protein